MERNGISHLLLLLLLLLCSPLAQAETELLLLDEQGLSISQVLNGSAVNLQDIPLFQIRLSSETVTTWVFQEIRARASGSSTWQAIPGFYTSHTSPSPANLFKSLSDSSFRAINGTSLALSNGFEAYTFMARSFSLTSWETFILYAAQGSQGVCQITQQGGTISPVCQNGGTCTSSFVDSECVCPFRYAGGDCSTCATGFSGLDCSSCSSSFFGPNCTACPPCGSHGTCHDGISGDGRCQCTQGFAGTYCQICALGFAGEFCEECAPTYFGPSCTACLDCGVNGVCSSGKGGDGSCICQTGFTLGADGTCSACSQGFYGEDCDRCPDCGPHGTCGEGVPGDIGGTGECLCAVEWIDGPEGPCSSCASGFFGASCTPCGDCGHGTCDDGRDGDGQCTCEPGWISSAGGICNSCAPGHFGDSCTPCPSCGLHGSCDLSTGECVCAQGWISFNGLCNACDEGHFGPSCTLCPSCGKGSCDEGVKGDIGGTGTCLCPDGWVSSGGGECNACDEGYFGPTCAPCPSCNAHGSCDQGLQGTGQCLCNPGWRNFNNLFCSACDSGYFGPTCAPCPSCGPHGTCDQGSAGDTGGTGECLCDPGWASFGGGSCNACAPGSYGPDCTPCPSCSPHGTCDEGVEGDTGGSGSCLCSTGWASSAGGLCNACAENYQGANCTECAPGYFGPTCQACSPCLRGVCDDGKLGTGGCVCEGSWSLGTDGQCTQCEGFRTGAHCEECQPGYFGKNCEPCQPCGPHGTCHSGVAGDGSCSCKEGWAQSTGSGLCDICAPGHFGPTCAACPACGSGACDEGLTGTGQCTCLPGFISVDGPCDECTPGHFGPTCQLCPSCGPHGTCDEGITQTGTCLCNVGWTNKDGGICNACKTGFSGSQCDRCVYGTYPDCFVAILCPNGCSGFGACDIRKGQCTCDSRFTGPDCSQCLVEDSVFPNCGKATPCPLGCSGHGTCLYSNGTCTCAPGYTTSSCSTCAPGYKGYPNCYLIQACPVQCSGRGTCNDMTGQCACEGNFGGSACNECKPGFAYPEEGCIPSVPCPADCGSHGACNLRNGTCLCSPSYSGATCETSHFCYAQPCLNGATCTEKEDRYVCTCTQGYGGENCAYLTADPEILSISPLVSPLAGRTLVISGNNLQSPLTVIYSVGEESYTIIIEQISSSKKRAVITFELILPATNSSGYSTLTFVNPSGNTVVVEGLYVTNICPVEGQYSLHGSCVECPSIGVCPGGDRIWPRPGYWNPDEQTPPAACPAPSSRCLGGKGSPCAQGYTGEFCAFCSEGYSWNKTSIACVACPEEGCKSEEVLPRASYFLIIFGSIVVLTALALISYKIHQKVRKPKKTPVTTGIQHLSRRLSIRASRLFTQAEEQPHAYSPFYSPEMGDFYAPPGVPMVGNDWRDVYTSAHRALEQNDPTLNIDPIARPLRSVTQELEGLCLAHIVSLIPSRSALHSQVSMSTNPDLATARIAGQVWKKIQKLHQKDLLVFDQKGEPKGIVAEAEIQKAVDRTIEEVAWRVVGSVNALNKGVFVSPAGYYRPFDLPYYVQTAEDKGSKGTLENRMFSQLYTNELLGLGISPCISFFGVYNGFNGSEASEYVSRHLHVNLFRNDKFKQDPYAAFHEAFFQTNEGLSQQPKASTLVGCSALACMLRGNELWLAWVGDCQAVLFRTDGQIISFCDPHVPEREAERDRIDRLGGIITNKGGIPKVAGVYTVTRAFGCHRHGTLISPEAGIISVDLQGLEQYLVLANEAFWGSVDEDTVAEILNEGQETSASNIADSLLQYARRMGSTENISVMVIGFTG